MESIPVELTAMFAKIKYHQLKLWKEDQYVDLHLVSSDSVTLHAHQIIVSANSSVLYERIRNASPQKEGKQIITEIEVPEATGAELSELLSLIYSGNWNDEVSYKDFIIPAFTLDIEPFVQTYISEYTASFDDEESSLTLLTSLYNKTQNNKIEKLLHEAFSLNPFRLIRSFNVSWLRFELFHSMLSKGEVFLVDKVVYMGTTYEAKANELIDLMIEKCNWDSTAKGKLSKALHDLLASTEKPACLVPTHLTICPVRLMSTDNSNREYTFRHFPPNQWALSGCIMYIMKYGNGIQPIARLRVQYRNIWTGERRFHEGETGRYTDMHRIIKNEVYFDDDEVVTSLGLMTGGRVDHIIFNTSKDRRYMRQHGTEEILDRYFPLPSPEFFDKGDGLTPLGPATLADECPVKTMDFSECLGVAVHGFMYSIEMRNNYRCWTDMYVVYSGWPNNALGTNMKYDFPGQCKLARMYKVF